jgi:beta-ketoacyl-acyl-carrier-protein synthase II
MGHKRVVITGMGVISPVGLDTATMWENVVAGRSGIGPITLFDTSSYDVHIAGEAHGFDPIRYMPSRDARRMDRYTQFAIAGLEEALAQSGLSINAHNAFDVGVIIGSGAGGVWTYGQGFDELREKGPRHLNPFHATSVSVDSASVHVAMRTGARGLNLGISTACSTGTDAIGLAFETIILGHGRAMITGGFDAAITPISIAAFDCMRALSHRNEDPLTASRPFDATRDGFVSSEGGAVLILEELDYALARGAQPLAEILAYAATSDAIHLTAPDSNGTGMAYCITKAMRRCGVQPEEISYINAHGTGTPVGDPAETRAIKVAFGDLAARLPISSTKSVTGHLMGGAGALEAVICVMALRSGCIPPTMNLHTPDPECDLDFVPNQARSANLGVVLSNSLGFGGHNTTLVFRAYNE